MNSDNGMDPRATYKYVDIVEIPTDEIAGMYPMSSLQLCTISQLFVYFLGKNLQKPSEQM